MGDYSVIDDVKKVVDYIEENVKGDITLDDIAEKVNLSKYHLHRVFKGITKKPLMEYARGRKLTSSIYELLNTESKIVDIAMNYQFEHEQSYIRSFKNMFEVSPAKFRREKKTVKIIEKIDLKQLTPVGSGLIIEPDFIIKPEFHIIGLKEMMTHEQNNKEFTANKVGRKFFYFHRQEIKNAINPEAYIALIRFIPDGRGYKYYMPSLEVTDLKRIPDGLAGETIPTHKYAVFKYIGLHKPEKITIESLNGIYGYIFGKWLRESGYLQPETFHFEYIDYSLTRNDYCEVDLYIPVKER